MAQDYLPPLPKPLDTIAANLANEGVPVAAIARSLTYPFAAVRETLAYFVHTGGISDMPMSDWPPTARRADRLPAFMAKDTEHVQLTSIQRALKLTRLQASFMLVLLRRDDVDKDTLHYVIESQRAMRRSRPNNPETTDPKMVDVVICNLRKRLKPLGIKIKTIWGAGYSLEEDSRAKVEKRLFAQQDGPAQKPNR